MRRLTLARIPWTYNHTTMDDLSPEGRAWVESYQPEGKGLRFLGSTGRGKTHRMLCAVRGLCERGISARYVSWALWLDDMRQAMGRDGDMAALKARIERPAVVALDDIGRERDTDWAQSQLDHLLERRTLSGGTVLIASNLTDEGLEMHLGDRLWSRIKTSTRPVVMTGKDWRATR
jgi:DNA replication protein DnaC